MSTKKKTAPAAKATTAKTVRKQYGRRAEGKTQTTISMSIDVLEQAKRNAESDGRSLSNYLEQLLKKGMK